MKILAFIGAVVGERCMNFMLEVFPDDAYFFLLSPEIDQATISTLKERGCRIARYGPEALQSLMETEREVSYDWLLNLWAPAMLPKNLLTLAKHRLNMHNSYVPYARGRDAASWTIRTGAPAGVTLLEMNERADMGPIWHQERVEAEFPITGGELFNRLGQACGEVFCRQWPAIRSGAVVPVPQPAGGTSFKRADTLADKVLDIDGDSAAAEVVSKLLAHDVSSEYAAIIVKDGVRYRARLSLERIPENG